jgi:beta-phosphoglucomutase-like phosphatase (HAD superfamily)
MTGGTGRFGVSPDQSIVVEDAVAGAEGARRAGMKSIGVSRSGAHLPADIVVPSLQQLEPNAYDMLLRGVPQYRDKTRILNSAVLIF